MRSIPLPLSWPACFYRCWPAGSYQVRSRSIACGAAFRDSTLSTVDSRQSVSSVELTVDFRCPAQNGGFWTTALPYVVPAMVATGHGDFARRLLEDAVASMKSNGIFEWQNLNHTEPDSCRCKLPCHTCTTLPCYPCAGLAAGVLNYTASVTNVLGATKMLS